MNPRTARSCFALLVGIGFTFRALVWRRRLSACHTPDPPGHPVTAGDRPAPPPVTVVVPVLEEQERLPALVDHFRRLREQGERLHVVLASTCREPVPPAGTPTTPRLCDEFSRKHPAWLCHHQIHDRDGSMASQINGALRACDHASGRLVAIYNADSRPSPGSLPWAAARLERQRPDVVQQHALYLRNWRELSTRPALVRPVLLAASAWQTRWSMGFERWHAQRAASARRDGGRLNPPFNYVIGHGLVLDARLYTDVGGLSERFPNEDAHLSIALAFREIAVLPNPYWELADSPDTVRGLLIQKRVWFGGPANAFRYGNDLASTTNRRVRLWWSSARLFNHAVCWLAGPVLGGSAIALTVGGGDVLLALVVLAAMFGYTAVCNDHALRRAVEATGETVAVQHRAEAAAGAVAAYLLHGASALWATALLIEEALTGRHAHKPRTPMRFHFDSDEGRADD